MAWVDALALRKDEKVVDSWIGFREIIGSTFDVTIEEEKKHRKRVTVKERKEGLLVLTTQRLLFLEGMEPDNKQLGEAVKLSLIDIDTQKVWFERAPLKPLDEVPGYDTHIFRLKRIGKRKDFNKFKKLLEEYIKKRNEQLTKERQKVVKFRIN